MTPASGPGRDPPGKGRRLGTGLPNAPVLDLKLSADRSTIYAATFGRGVYKVPRPQG